jgi:hypothetical protein
LLTAIFLFATFAYGVQAQACESTLLCGPHQISQKVLDAAGEKQVAHCLESERPGDVRSMAAQAAMIGALCLEYGKEKPK